MSARSMDLHARCLELVGTALDFPLDAQEQELVRRHLATCADCAATATAMRSDAAALAAVERPPAPGRVRMAVVRAATDPRAPRGTPGTWRWTAVAAALVLVLVGGAILTGVLMERTQRTTPVASQPVTAVTSSPSSPPSSADPDRTSRPSPVATPRPTDRSTPPPTRRPSTEPTRRPSAEPTRRPTTAGWTDLGVLDTLAGSTASLVLPGPDGGLVLIGREASSALPSVWISEDGVRWTAVDQLPDVFGGRVPGSGVLHGDRLWVVGWDVSVEAGGQRAIWSSADGRTWTRVTDATGLLGTQQADVRIAAGERGLIAWTTAGRVWTSRDGETWTRQTSVGIDTLTDVAVTGDAWTAVGRDGERAAMTRSTDGRTWSTPSRRSAAADDQPGIEADAEGTLLAWVGTQAFDVANGSWRARGAAMPTVGAPADVVGGRGFAALLAATGAGVQRAALGDASEAWRDRQSEAADRGARTRVGAVAVDDGWFVLTRQGTTYRGWMLIP